MFFVTIEDLRVICLLISVIYIVYRVSELDIFENLFKTEYEARWKFLTGLYLFFFICN